MGLHPVKMPFVTSLVFIFTSLVAFSALADTWGAAPAFYSQYATFGIEQMGLGNACEESLPGPGERPCNPAFAPLTQGHSLQADVVLGGDYSQIFQYAQYIYQNDKADLVQSIVNRTTPTTFSGFASLGYTTDSFNIWATPFHSYYFSVVRNSVNPEVSLVAMQESSMAAQYGLRLDDDFSVGLQVAGFTRRFVATQSSVFDFTADPASALAVQNQNGLFFEPGFAYVNQSPWHFRVTGMVKELGFVDQGYDEIPLGTILDFGTGVSLPIDPDWGRLDFLLNFTSGASSVVSATPWRLGATYKIGLISSFVGYNPSDFSLGANIGFNKLRVGLMFQQLQLDQAKNSVLSQVSYVF